MIDWQYKTVVARGTKPMTFLSTSSEMSASEFAIVIEQTINDEALEGWEFAGLHSYSTNVSILIFRKPGSVGRSYTDRPELR